MERNGQITVEIPSRDYRELVEKATRFDILVSSIAENIRNGEDELFLVDKDLVLELTDQRRVFNAKRRMAYRMNAEPEEDDGK